MELNTRNEAFESFHRKANDAFQLVKFDNVQHSVEATQAKDEMTRLVNEAKLAKKQLDAADIMLQDMQDRRTVLAEESLAANKKSHAAAGTYELKTVAMDNCKQFLWGLLTDTVTLCKPWKRPQRNAGSSKTRPINQ